MSVNGSGIDPKNNKPLSDPTSWSVKLATGEVADYRPKPGEKPKPAAGIPARDAFAVVRKLRKEGTFAAAVRS